MRWLLLLLLTACTSSKGQDDSAGLVGSDTGKNDGQDPSADDDGDGFSNGEERAQNTDPNDADDHPYAGGWPIDACRDSVQPTGDRAGDIASGWSRMDQFGEQISLHDFCDHAVLLVGSAFW